MNRDKILEIAKAENGYKETPAGSNKTKFGMWYGVDGVAWCAIFVSWVFDKAGFPLPPIQSPKGAAYVPFVYDHYRKANKITNSPYKGDIVIYDWNNDKSGDHIGIFVDWVEAGKSFHAWEGNTSPTSDSNGGQVMLRVRYKSQVMAFINPETSL